MKDLKNIYYTQLQIVSEVLLSCSRQILGPRISFFQINDEIVEKKSIKLTNLLTARLEFVGEAEILQNEFKKTPEYQAQKVIQKIMESIDQCVESFDGFFGTVRFTSFSVSLFISSCRGEHI
jgi:hypothetical protein